VIQCLLEAVLFNSGVRIRTSVNITNNMYGPLETMCERFHVSYGSRAMHGNGHKYWLWISHFKSCWLEWFAL